MAYEIKWTAIALEDYHSIIKYLSNEWSLSVAIDFKNIVNRKLNNLSQRPFSGIKSEKDPDIRSILFTPHNRLYYRILKNTIELLTIIDIRSNPAKNPF